MFEFLKRKKDNVGNEEGSNASLYNTNCICTQNKYPDSKCNIILKDENIVLEYENGKIEINYSDIKSCGKILNNKTGIREAMDSGVLSQGVLQSAGFLAGNFYTMTNQAKVFIYLKYKDGNVTQTFLAECNKGADNMIKQINKRK